MASRKRPLALEAAPERLALPAPKIVKRRDDNMFELRVLLPDGGNIVLHEEDDEELQVNELLRKIKWRLLKQAIPCAILWEPHVYLEDAAGNRIQPKTHACTLCFLQWHESFSSGYIYVFSYIYIVVVYRYIYVFSYIYIVMQLDIYIFSYIYIYIYMLYIWMFVVPTILVSPEPG